MSVESRRVRVVVADDDARFRAAVRDLLADDSRLELVGETGDGADLAGLVASSRADLVLIDVRMPHGGAEAVASVSAVLRSARVRVVGVSAQTGASTVAAMVAAGATGFLPKGRIGALLPDVVVRCAAGQVVLAVDNAADVLRQLIGATTVSDASE